LRFADRAYRKQLLAPMRAPAQSTPKNGRLEDGEDLTFLGWLPPYLLASSFACQSLFDPLFLPGLEIKGVLLGFFYDVFLQNLTLKAPQGVFNGFPIMYLNLSHLILCLIGFLPALATTATTATFATTATAPETATSATTATAFARSHGASFIHRDRPTFKICTVEFRNRVRCFLIR
jgi:hypothetical protein